MHTDRTPEYQACQESRYDVFGSACIRGYRMRVKDVLELLAHGASREEILTDYPFLEADDLRACLEFAAAQNDHVLLHAAAS